MPDKKLTDNEIIKALECCNGSGEGCADCPLYDEHCDSGYILIKLSFGLIKRYEAEIERLNENIDLINQQNVKVDALTVCREAKVRAEAIKEFAEKMKGVIPEIDDTYIERIVEDYIDNLVKETEGQ